MSAYTGQVVNQASLDQTFLTGPGESLVRTLLSQLASIPQFVTLFGPYTPGSYDQRWADYHKIDWNMRQLPSVNLFESETENKESANAFLNGTLQMQVFWPASMRRSDLTRVPRAFQSVMLNFFESQWAYDMIDEIQSVDRPSKVPGLSELGRVLDWVPDVEGIVEDQQVPVSVLNIKYQIDLREWYRVMETQNRTVLNPFQASLNNLSTILGSIDGLNPLDQTQIQVVLPFESSQSNNINEQVIEGI